MERPQYGHPFITFRFPKDLISRLIKAATREKRSRSELARELIDEGLAAREKRSAPQKVA